MSGMTLSLKRAVLCMDCEAISDECGHKCPACAGGPLVSLSAILNRTVVYSPCALGAHPILLSTDSGLALCKKTVDK